MSGAALAVSLWVAVSAGVGPLANGPVASGALVPPVAVQPGASAVAGARCETDTSQVFGQAELDGARFTATSGGLVIEPSTGGRVVWTACDGLPATYVQAVAALPAGGLAVAYRGLGVWSLDPATGQQRQLVERAELRWVTALAAQGDDLWIGTLQRGLWRLRGELAAPAFPKRFRTGRVSARLPRADRGLRVGRDRGGLWLVSRSGHVRRLLRGSVQGLARAAAPDGGGGVLVDRGPHVCQLEVATRTCEPLAASGPLALPPAASPLHVTSLAVHPDAGGVPRLWVGTFDRGVLVQTPDGWRAPAGAGAPPRLVNQLVSADGALWAATPTGAFRLRGGRWDRFGEHSGLPTDHVNAVHVDANGAVWFATSGGLATWREGGGMHRVDEDRGLPYRIVYSVTRASGRIVAGTAYGLGVLRDGRFDSFRVGPGGLSDNWINAVAEGPGGSLLIGTYDRGVDVLRGGRVERLAGLESAWVNPGGLYRSPQTAGTFVATLGDGLYHVGDDGEVRRWPGVGALPSSDVTAVQAFAGRLWIGTREGLASWPSDAVAQPRRS